jgi:hypothetical protein
VGIEKSKKGYQNSDRSVDTFKETVKENRNQEAFTQFCVGPLPTSTYFKETLRQYKETLHEDEGLRILVNCYLEALGPAQKEAERIFWELIKNLS